MPRGMESPGFSRGEEVNIYPAHAGINRLATRSYEGLSNLPRTRGDKPLEAGA